MEMQEKIYDVIIIGSGPAGLSAAIYAERAKLSTLVLEASYISGGQVVNTYEVDNYPGLPGISGMDLGNTLREHAEKLGTQIVQARVTELELEGEVKKVITRKETYRSKTVLIATGAVHRGLGVAGEKELSGSGVSYCATCDGAFFKPYCSSSWRWRCSSGRCHLSCQSLQEGICYSPKGFFKGCEGSSGATLCASKCGDGLE